ncbi:MAG TPA: tetratricopeptide repeat protein [Thermoanaerobaculaceae bacterium]|nr:tetratricopeptide repeat protein [Thermoanaerobaculaceae bacterium]
MAAVVLAAGCASSGSPQGKANAELKAGVRAAERNYWQEALFRFERARALVPADPEVLNDVAVAYEALGRFDEALATYKEALKGSPRSIALKKNYARFAEFYTSYAKGAKPKKEDADAAR